MKKLMLLSMLALATNGFSVIFENVEVNLKSDFDILHYKKFESTAIDNKDDNKIKLNYLSTEVNLQDIKVKAGLNILTDEKHFNTINIDTLNAKGYINYESQKLSDGLYFIADTTGYMGPKKKEGDVYFGLGVKYIFNDMFTLSSKFQYDTSKIIYPKSISTNNTLNIKYDMYMQDIYANFKINLQSNEILFKKGSEEKKANVMKYTYTLKTNGKYMIEPITAEVGYLLDYSKDINVIENSENDIVVDSEKGNNKLVGKQYIFDRNLSIGGHFNFNDIYKGLYLYNSIKYTLNNHIIGFDNEEKYTKVLDEIKLNDDNIDKENKKIRIFNFNTTLGREFVLDEKAIMNPQLRLDYDYKTETYNQLKLTEIVKIQIKPVDKLYINMKMTLPVVFSYDNTLNKFKPLKIGFGGMIGIDYTF